MTPTQTIVKTPQERLSALQIAFRRERVTRFYVLYNEGQAWNPKEKELKALRDELVGWFDLKPDQTAIAEGNGCEVQIGVQSIEKSWASMAKVYKAVGGLKAFLKICTVTFKALADVLGNSAAQALQVESQSGHRKLVAVAKPPAVA